MGPLTIPVVAILFVAGLGTRSFFFQIFLAPTRPFMSTSALSRFFGVSL